MQPYRVTVSIMGPKLFKVGLHSSHYHLTATFRDYTSTTTPPFNILQEEASLPLASLQAVSSIEVWDSVRNKKVANVFFKDPTEEVSFEHPLPRKNLLISIDYLGERQ